MEETIDDLVNEMLSEKEPEAAEPATFAERCEAFSNDVRRHFLSMGPAELERLQRDADVRFSDSLPMNKVRDAVVALVGAGGLGNWIWRVLLGMGFRRVHVFDDDFVGVENLGPQAHKAIDIDLPKVEAVRREAMAFRGVEIFAHKMRVGSVAEIAAAMGGHPDILIGATDSAEFRNAVIEGFKTDEESCRIKLFVDLRMSLGDWNAFAFTPSAVRGFGAFSNAASPLRAAYDRYVKLAVFDPDEAVHEPCTARAITYTGANVASYVGALLHWWMGGGDERCASDHGFLADTFYKDERTPGEFNWLYRFSSRGFDAVTESPVQAKNRMLASCYEPIAHALSAVMAREWDDAALTYVTVDDPEALNGCSRSLHTEAYMDRGGEMHLYQACREEGGRRCAFADFDLAVEMASVRLRDGVSDADWKAVELEESNRLSGDRIAMSMLKHNSAASGIMSECGLAMWGDPESMAPRWAALYSQRAGGRWSLFVLVARPFGSSDDDAQLDFGLELWRMTDGSGKFERLDADRLPTEFGSEECFSIWMSRVRWTCEQPSEASVVFVPEWGDRAASGETADLSGKLEALKAVVGAAPEAPAGPQRTAEKLVAVRDVPDGFAVELNGVPGRYVKRSDGGRVYLVDEDGVRLDVDGSVEATVAP